MYVCYIIIILFAFKHFFLFSSFLVFVRRPARTFWHSVEPIFTGPSNPKYKDILKIYVENFPYV